MQAQKQSAGGTAHASTSDLEGSSKQSQHNNNGPNKDTQKDAKLSPFTDGSKLSESGRKRSVWGKSAHCFTSTSTIFQYDVEVHTQHSICVQ